MREREGGREGDNEKEVGKEDESEKDARKERDERGMIAGDGEVGRQEGQVRRKAFCSRCTTRI